MKFTLAAAFLVLGLFVPMSAHAMPIERFAHMNNDDEATLITAMVEGASGMLKANGQPNQALKIVTLFKDASPTGGVNQFAMKLKSLYAQNVKNQSNARSTGKVYTVEDAMELTLKDNGITVPAAWLVTITQNFRQAGLNRQ